MKLELLTRFATLSLLCVAALAVAMGFALSSLLPRAVSEWEWEAVRDLALEILRELGYTVLAARHGAEALLTCERHAGSIALLLTDVVMPGMGGIELAERLTILRPGIRVLFTSGYSGDRVAHSGRAAASPELLRKPFTPEALARRVRQELDTGPAGPSSAPTV